MKNLLIIKQLYKCAVFLFCLIPLSAHAQIITTISGTGTVGCGTDGIPAIAADMMSPFCIAIDGSGNLYIADWGTQCVKKISTSGIISTYAGMSCSPGYSGDGGMATAAKFNQCMGLAFDASGNLFIADSYNARVRMVNRATGVITTIAGNGTTGYSGDGGPATAAELNGPFGLVFDAAGNLYISDAQNNRIRKVNTAGIITTIAGTGSGAFGGDGGLATAASMYWPEGMVFDVSGNMYLCDYHNSRIRKINTSGIISTIAGTSSAGYSGDGGPASSAQLDYPSDIAKDRTGNIYFGERNNHVIRKISTAGIISTIAGTGTSGFSGDGGLATAAMMTNPSGITIDTSSNIYFSDATYARVRKITNCLPVASPITGSAAICVGQIMTLTCATSGGSWSSISPGIAAISSGGVVSGIVPGNANILYTVTNSCGSTSDTQLVTVFAYPDSGIISGPDSTCRGYSITLSETISGGSWSSSNTSIATIGTSGIVTGVATGSVVISYTVGNICDTVNATKSIFVKPNTSCQTGIEEKQLSTGLDLFPNPNNGTFVLTVPAGTSDVAIHIYDIYGREVTQYTLQSNGTNVKTVRLANVLKGTYLIKVVTKEATYQQKVMLW